MRKQLIGAGILIALSLTYTSFSFIDVEYGASRHVVLESTGPTNYLVLQVATSSLRSKVLPRLPMLNPLSTRALVRAESAEPTIVAAAQTTAVHVTTDITSLILALGTTPPGVLIPGNEIGLSSGLAHTLAVLDTLTRGDLTNGKLVAATGTVDSAGNVGNIGGLVHKLDAAAVAGATVTFVPAGQAAEAAAVAPEGLVVVSVSSVAEAVHILCARGGVSPLCG